MKILQLRLHAEPNQIKIVLNVLYTDDPGALRVESGLIYQEIQSAKKVHPFMKKLFGYAPHEIFGAALSVESEGPAVFNLSTNPIATLDFLTALGAYAAKHHFDSIRLLESFDPHSKKTLSYSEAYLACSESIPEENVLQKLVAETLVITKQFAEKYRSTLAALKEIYEYSEENIPFTQRLNPIKRLQIFLSQFDVTGKKADYSDVRNMLTMLLKLRAQGNDIKLAYVLAQFIANAKEKLVAPCLGEIAFDKNLYERHFTELQLIYTAKFVELPDGNICIPVQDNIAYKRFYAPTVADEKHLENELLFLASVLKLTIADYTNFHNEIIFSSHSSLTLKQYGLHITPENLDKVYAASYLNSELSQAYASNFLFQPQPPTPKGVSAKPAP